MKNTPPRILVVDDEPEALKILRTNFEIRSYDVVIASNGPEALKAFDLGDFDLVLLDVFLPGMDGFEVCTRLREMSRSVGIIMMSAQYCGENDKVRGLELGADCYLSKPFGIEELLAYVNAVLRRTDDNSEYSSDRCFAFGTCKFDIVERSLFFPDGREEKLTHTEYRLLELLVANAGKVMTHRSLLTSIWGPEYLNDRQYLWVYVKRLRRKLRDETKAPQLLFSVSGVGYSFTADVTEHSRNAA